MQSERLAANILAVTSRDIIAANLGTYLKEARDGGYRAFMKYDKVEIDKLSYELDEPLGLLKRNKTLFTYDVASQQIREVDKGDSGE